jgi:hypothetical protein
MTLLAMHGAVPLAASRCLLALETGSQIDHPRVCLRRDRHTNGSHPGVYELGAAGVELVGVNVLQTRQVERLVGGPDARFGADACAQERFMHGRAEAWVPPLCRLYDGLDRRPDELDHMGLRKMPLGEIHGRFVLGPRRVFGHKSWFHGSVPCSHALAWVFAPSQFNLLAIGSLRGLELHLTALQGSGLHPGQAEARGAGRLLTLCLRDRVFLFGAFCNSLGGLSVLDRLGRSALRRIVAHKAKGQPLVLVHRQNITP